jgi:hypothetical protein
VEVGAAVMVAAAMLIALVESHVSAVRQAHRDASVSGDHHWSILGIGTLVAETLIGFMATIFGQRRGSRAIFITTDPECGTTSRSGARITCEPNSLRRTTAIGTLSRPTHASAFGSWEAGWQQCSQVHVNGTLWVSEHPGFSSPPPLRIHSVPVIALNDLHRATRSLRDHRFFCLRLRISGTGRTVSSFGSNSGRRRSQVGRPRWSIGLKTCRGEVEIFF